jgi:hypothetical protein
MKNILCAGLLLTWAAATSMAAETVELKQRWITGKQYVTSMETSQKTEMAIGEVKMEQATTMTIETSIAVRPHEDGKRKRLSLSYDRMAMEVLASGQKISYDSAKPKEGADPLNLGNVVGPIIGKELKLIANENDEIAEVENFEEFMKQMGPLGAPAGIDFTKMFSSDGLKDILRQGSLQSFPGRPVAPGDSWPFSNKVAMPGAGSVTVKGTHTFKGMVDHDGARCAEILIDGTILMELDPAGGAPAGAAEALAAMKMKLNEGTLKGPVWFDPQLGIARDSELVQEMTMSMKNPVDPAADMVIPIKQTIRTKLVKVVDVK